MVRRGWLRHGGGDGYRLSAISYRQTADGARPLGQRLTTHWLPPVALPQLLTPIDHHHQLAVLLYRPDHDEARRPARRRNWGGTCRSRTDLRTASRARSREGRGTVAMVAAISSAPATVKESFPVPGPERLPAATASTPGPARPPPTAPRTYTSSRPDSFDTYASHFESGDTRGSLSSLMLVEERHRLRLAAERRQVDVAIVVGRIHPIHDRLAIRREHALANRIRSRAAASSRRRCRRPAATRAHCSARATRCTSPGGRRASTPAGCCTPRGSAVRWCARRGR